MLSKITQVYVALMLRLVFNIKIVGRNICLHWFASSMTVALKWSVLNNAEEKWNKGFRFFCFPEFLSQSAYQASQLSIDQYCLEDLESLTLQLFG